jgi:uncharacterized GH25 family protein
VLPGSFTVETAESIDNTEKMKLIFGHHKYKTGTDVMILKIFSPKNSAKKLAFLTKNQAKLCKILIKTLFFSPKIVENRRKL